MSVWLTMEDVLISAQTQREAMIVHAVQELNWAIIRGRVMVSLHAMQLGPFKNNNNTR